MKWTGRRQSTNVEDRRGVIGLGAFRRDVPRGGDHTFDRREGLRSAGGPGILPYARTDLERPAPKKTLKPRP
jgi:hypothetical protein